MTPTLVTREASPAAVANTLITTRPPNAAHLLAALDGILANRSALARCLAQVDDDARATEVASQSYWHHNGFAKLVLHATSEFRIRLHIWPAGSDRRGETNPHGHRWDFASTVLCGEGLKNIEYIEVTDGLPYVRYRYGGSGTGGLLSPAGDARLRACGIRIIRTHDRYAVTTDTVHTVDPLGTSVVATLVVQGAPRLASALVYCAPGQETDQPGRPIRPGEVRQLVRAVVDALDDSGRAER